MIVLLILVKICINLMSMKNFSTIFLDEDHENDTPKIWLILNLSNKEKLT